MKHGKRILSALLTLAMLASLVPSALAAESYRWPVPSSKSISQKYGGGHVGIDITGSKGCDVVATKSGTVYYVYKGCINSSALSTKVSCEAKGCNPNCGKYTTSGMKICNWGYGNGVVIKHSDGSGYSMYAHLNSVNVSKGASVAQGQKIGTMGSAGMSTGTHLHFEMSTGMSMSGTYCKPSGNINTNTGNIAYVYAGGAGAAENAPERAKAVFSSADGDYTKYAFQTNTNAGIVTKVTKQGGVACTAMGAYLYDANGKLIKKQTDSISQSWITPARTAPYYTWYNINEEMGVTLTPGTTYKYVFFGIFDGQELTSGVYSFTTTGTAPSAPTTKTIPVKFYLNSEGTDSKVVYVKEGQTLGTLPTPAAREGYTFAGYYTAWTGGSKVTSSTVISGVDVLNLYPQYTKNAVEQPAAQQYTVFFMLNGSYYQSRTVTNGSTYGELPVPPTPTGYEFQGWYTSSVGGTKVTSSTRVNLTGSQALYPHFTKIEQPQASGTITLQIGNPRLTVNGVSKAIDDGGTVPVIRNDRTLLPVRAVIEAMGGTVGWDNSTRTVSLTKDGKTLYLQIDSTLCVDSKGKYYALDSAPIILNSRTMLPIRFVVEYFGGTVDWDGGTQSVIIQYKK